VSVAFVFPGQGSQKVGMGQDLASSFPEAASVFAEADEALGLALAKLCFEGPEADLQLTANTQPAILAASIAAHRLLAARGFRPDFVAGHSVGQGAMAAILGLDLRPIEEACAEAAQGEVVSPANINSPGQVVIAGHAGAVARASEACKARGAKRAVPLTVSAPFHCSLMRPAQDRLKPVLEAIPFADPAVPVVSNVDATPVGVGSACREGLLRQVSAPVRWQESVEWLAAKGVTTFVEVGPGHVLSGLVKKIAKAATVLHVEDKASLEKACAALAGREQEQKA
jgi:[acyl-carrier-protein] S-malonyltransferase